MELLTEWKVGFDDKTIYFIDKSVLIFISGQHVCFVDKDGGETYMLLPSFAATKLIVHPSDNVFALVEEEKVNPNIFLYNYPQLESIGIIGDFTKLDIISISFSESCYLAAITGLPQTRLILWNYKTQKELFKETIEADIETIVTMTICPTNWHQIAVICGRKLYLYLVENCGNQCLVRNTNIQLPPKSARPGCQVEARIPDSRTTIADGPTNNISAAISLPPSVIAGVSDAYYKEFLESQDTEDRCECVSYAWNESGHLYLGCIDGQLIKFDPNEMKFRMLINNWSNTNQNNEELRIETPVSRQDNHLDLTDNMRCLCYAKEGLYMGGKDGILRIAKAANNELVVSSIEDIHRLGVRQEDISISNNNNNNEENKVTEDFYDYGISKLVFSSDYLRLAVASGDGGMLHVLIKGDANNSPRIVYELGQSNYVLVGMSQLFGNRYFVTLKRNGLVQFWDTEIKKLCSSLNLNENASSVCASPLWSTVAVGLDNGSILMIDTRDISQPRVVYNMKIHNQPIQKIKYDKRSQVVISASNDGHVVILSGLVSDNFKVMGMTDFEGDLTDMCVISNPTSDDIAQVAVLHTTIPATKESNKLVYFELPASLINDPSNEYDDVSGLFREDAIRKMTLTFESAVYGCMLGIQSPEERSPCLYAVDAVNHTLCCYQIPAQVPKKAGNKASYLAPIQTYNNMMHDDPVVSIVGSINYRLLLTYGREGTVRVMDTKDKSIISVIRLNQTKCDGIADACFNFNATRFYSCGYDGSISMIGISKLDGPQVEIQSEYNSIINRYTSKSNQQNSELQSLKSVASLVKLNEINQSNENTIDTKTLMTWSEYRKIEHQEEENQHYASTRNKIQTDLDNIRHIIRSMVDENDTLDDLEKIDRQEFELDVVTKGRIMDEINKEVLQVRDEIELKDLSNKFIHDVLKRECWDNMHVKGRSLCSFSNQIEVINFPLRERSSLELEQLDRVIKRREIEMGDYRDRKLYTESLNKAALPKKPLIQTSKLGSNEDEEDYKNENGADFDEADEDETHSGTNLSPHDLKDYENFVKVAPNTKYLYPQLELETRNQKINQIILIKDIIYQMKVQFNKEFNDVYLKKEQEIIRIKEKNQRINKILEDIDQAHLIVPDPEMSSLERPEKLLVVEDHEVKVEKYLSDEEKRRLEEERRQEEERIRRERLDNWRERGLEDMMGGVLEIRREDELKKDIPKPAFLEAGKPVEEWNDEEKKQFEEYERKVRELQEERDKYKKQLETEYKKLATIIDDAKIIFDETIMNLFNRQISVMMSVYQEEIKILRFQASLLLDEMLEGRRREVLELMSITKKERDQLRVIIVTTNDAINEANEVYETLNAEEKIMEKGFRKEFLDVHGPIYEHLTKLYKKRPKQRGSANPTGVNPMSLASYSKYNPYSDKPPYERVLQHMKEQLQYNINELNKNDAAMNSESIEPNYLERLFRTRKRRIEKEFNMKMKALEIEEMKNFQEKRQQEDKSLETDEENMRNLMRILDDQKYLYQVNKEVQMEMKQGSVEVEAEPGWIHDFSDSVLMNYGDVEELNNVIRSLGNKKVHHMKKARDNKKRLLHIEWELKRMLMEYEDLVRKMREIQCFKITKEIQKYLATNDYEGLINAEIQKMEQTISRLKVHQARNINKKKSRLKNINDKSLVKLRDENEDLNNEFVELNVQVNERRHIQAGFPSESHTQNSAEQRYKKILQRQHLIDLAKSQAREVAVLRSEVERLRMRTFPALVQPR